jgi:hypothetical protein
MAATVQSFSNPAAGAAFTTTVPVGKAWEILGGSFVFTASGTVTTRQVGLLVEIGGIPVWSSGNSGSISASQTRTVVLYPQGHYMAGVFFTEWVPVGCGPAGPLPAGTTITLPISSIQAGDQVSDVRLLVDETDPVSSVTWQTFSNPAAGSGFTLTVPDDEEWRIYGGGCTFDADATVAMRVPGVVVKVDGSEVFVHYNIEGATPNGPTANVTRDICYFDQRSTLPSVFTSLPYNVGLPQITLPNSATVQGVFENMVAGDQVTDIGFLIGTSAVEEAPIQPVSGTFGFALRFD